MSDPTSEKKQDQQDATTHASDAGPPANQAERQPSNEELDRRDRLKAAPRRAAGPPLRDDPSEATSRDAAPYEPPPATDPMSEPLTGREQDRASGRRQD